MSGSRVVSLGHYQPSRVLTNDELGYAVIRLSSVSAVRVIDPGMTRSAGAPGGREDAASLPSAYSN